MMRAKALVEVLLSSTERLPPMHGDMIRLPRLLSLSRGGPLSSAL